MNPHEKAIISSGNSGQKGENEPSCSQNYTLFTTKPHKQQILLQLAASCHSYFQSATCDLAWSYHPFQMTFGLLRLFSKWEWGVMKP